jgi:hypothetical protein
MYATIVTLEGVTVIAYLGTDERAAHSCSEQLDGTVVSVLNVTDLASALADKQIERKVTAFAEGLSEAAQKVLDKLKVEDAEELGQKLREQGEKAAAEVRSLGIKSMKVVGDGFINLGELLKKADQDDAP